MAEQESATARIHRLVLQRVCASVMDELIAACKSEGLEGVGFAVMLFDFGDGGSLAYASNGHRQDMIKLLRETLTKIERSA